MPTEFDSREPLHNSPLLVDKSSWSVNDHEHSLSSCTQGVPVSNSDLLQTYITQFEHRNPYSNFAEPRSLSASTSGNWSCSLKDRHSFHSSQNEVYNPRFRRQEYRDLARSQHLPQKQETSSNGRKHAYMYTKNIDETQQNLDQKLFHNSKVSDLESYLRQDDIWKYRDHTESLSKSNDIIDSNAYSQNRAKFNHRFASSSILHDHLHQARRYPSISSLQLNRSQNRLNKSSTSLSLHDGKSIPDQESLKEFLALEKQCSARSSQETLKSIDQLDIDIDNDIYSTDPKTDILNYRKYVTVTPTQPQKVHLHKQTSYELVDDATNLSAELKHRLEMATMFEKKILNQKQKTAIREDIIRKQCHLDTCDSDTCAESSVLWQFQDRGLNGCHLYNTERLNYLLKETKKLLDKTSKGIQKFQLNNYQVPTKKLTSKDSMDINIAKLKMMLSKYASTKS